jgi:hypothetical protein
MEKVMSALEQLGIPGEKKPREPLADIHDVAEDVC